MSTETDGDALAHLPFFIAQPGETDQLFIIVTLFIIAAIVAVGVFYFRLHALPEQMAHRVSHTQLQLVGVMALLALFTHNGLFWVAALLLAAMNVPDFLSPIQRIADALDRQAPPPAPQEATQSGRDADPVSAPASPPVSTPAKGADQGGTADHV